MLFTLRVERPTEDQKALVENAFKIEKLRKFYHIIGRTISDEHLEVYFDSSFKVGFPLEIQVRP